MLRIEQDNTSNEDALELETNDSNLGNCQRGLYAISFGLSTFDVISDILLVIEWYNDPDKLVLATLLLIGVFLSNIVTAMSLYTAMVEIIEVILALFGLGSSYHLVSHIIFFKGERFWGSSSVKIYHLLSLIEVQIESSISTLLQIVHITIFNSLSIVAIISLCSSLLSIGYNYSYHLYRIIDAMHSYFSLKIIYLKIVSSLDVVSRSMSYAVIYGIFIDKDNIWRFIIAISVYIIFNCILAIFCVNKTLLYLPVHIKSKITISPLFLGIACCTSGGFMHSIIALSWNQPKSNEIHYLNFYRNWKAISFASLEIIIRFILSMISCVIYARLGDSFQSSGDDGTDKSNYDQAMFIVCQIGCWLALLNVIVSNIMFKCVYSSL